MKKLIPVYLLGLMAAPYSAHALTYFVNGSTGNDAVTCTSIGTPCLTIEEAIQQAEASAGDDTINVAAGTYNTGPMTGTIMDISGAQNITIVGAGTTSTIIDGGGSLRGLRVAFGSVVSVSDLTIQNCSASGSLAEGTGVRNEGSLTLDTVLVQSNSTLNGDGGGIFNGIDNPTPATLTIFNSTIAGNDANGRGGGISNGGGDSDAAVGTLVMVNSTISGNTSGAASGGESAGGGIYNSIGSTSTLFNVTIADNTASNSTPGDPDGLIGGGGVYNIGTMNINNTLIANNDDDSTADANDCVGNLDSTDGYNLVEDVTGCAFIGSTTGSITKTDPNIGNLANNGGPTPTHALLEFSDAIDAGDPAGCVNNTGGVMTTDQRDSTRPLAGIAGGAAICDIGAFEAAAGTTPDDNGGGGGGCSLAMGGATANFGLVSLLFGAVSGLFVMRRRSR